MTTKTMIVIALILILTALIGVQHAHREARASTSTPAQPTQHLKLHRFKAAAVHTPTTWIELSSGSDHTTWGARDRSATVTLGDIGASPLPPAGALRAAYSVLQHDTQTLTDLTLIDVDHDPTTSIGEFAVLSPGAPADRICVRQAWRRVTNDGTQHDLVATWTQRHCGDWPVDLPRLLPRMT